MNHNGDSAGALPPLTDAYLRLWYDVVWWRREFERGVLCCTAAIQTLTTHLSSQFVFNAAHSLCLTSVQPPHTLTVMTSPRPRSPLPSAADLAAAPLAAAASVVSHLPSLSSLSSSLSSVRSVRSSLTSAINEHAPGLSSTLHRLRNEAPTSLSSALDTIRDEAPSLSSALSHVRDGTVSSAMQERLARYKEKAGEAVARVQQGEDETEKRLKESTKRKEEKQARKQRKHRMLKDSAVDDDGARSAKRALQPSSDDETQVRASDSMDTLSPTLSASSTASSSVASLSAPSTPALSAAAASLPVSAPPSPSPRPDSPPSPIIDPTVWPSFEPSALLVDLTALLSSPPPSSLLLSPPVPSLLSLPPPEPFATAVEMLRSYDEMCANVAAQRTELADVWAGMQGGLATAEKQVQWLQEELTRTESEREATTVR